MGNVLKMQLDQRAETSHRTLKGINTARKYRTKMRALAGS